MSDRTEALEWVSLFMPDVARKVDALSKLVEARNQLNNLISYMDGKSGAEDLVAKLLNDPTLLKSLAAAPKPEAPAGGES